MLSKVTSIFFIPKILNTKENKVYIVRKGKIFSLQVINQVSSLIFLDNNDSVSKVEIEKIDYYLGV